MKKKGSISKTGTLMIRLTPEDKTKIIKKATSIGVSVSELTRSALLSFPYDNEESEMDNG